MLIRPAFKNLLMMRKSRQVCDEDLSRSSFRIHALIDVTRVKSLRNFRGETEKTYKKSFMTNYDLKVIENNFLTFIFTV